MFMKYHIKQFERGLLFRRGDFVRLLEPGTYRTPIWNWVRDRIDVIDTLKTRFEHPLLDRLHGWRLFAVGSGIEDFARQIFQIEELGGDFCALIMVVDDSGDAEGIGICPIGAADDHDGGGHGFLFL